MNHHHHPYMYYPYGGFWGHHHQWGFGPYPTHMKVPQELAVDGTSSPKSVFIGGLASASLSLEYLKTGATPSIKVTITEAGQTATWDITTIPDDYQIKENFAVVSPGAQIEIDVADCMARLRWCEVVCC